MPLRVRCSSCGGATHPAAESVHGCSVQIADRISHPRDPIPPLPYLHECLLHQVLSLIPVPGHQVERAEQARVLGIEETLECLGTIDDPLPGGET